MTLVGCPALLRPGGSAATIVAIIICCNHRLDLPPGDLVGGGVSGEIERSATVWAGHNPVAWDRIGGQNCLPDKPMPK